MKKERVNLFIIPLLLFYITIIPCNASLFAFMSTLNTSSLRERITGHIWRTSTLNHIYNYKLAVLLQWVNSANLLARQLLKFHKNSMRQLVSEINHNIPSPSKLGTNCRICLNPGIKLFPLQKKAEIIYLNFAILLKACIINKGHSACFVSSSHQYSLGIMKYCALFS